MKYYVQFLTLSTGYVQGSIPPVFKDENKKPVEMLGSDGVRILDGRLSLNSMINETNNTWSKHVNKNSIVGFEIRKGVRFGSNDTVLYRYLQPGYLNNN